ncbi:hypothetical protein [Sphingomonas panni]|uniref:hypothetical protein n=1 Tax=Sphingomonas panni TaxID=237612 RepID=UPI001F5BCB36|nr:hypothetical protein [Sphingomonas panni]
MRIELDARGTLAAVAADRDETLTHLSRIIGRGDRFLANFVHKGRPDKLPDTDRELLSKYLGIESQRLA